MSDLDRIPADDDPEAGARALRQARSQLVVVLSPNTLQPLPDAEVFAVAAAGGGATVHVVGWRTGKPHELQPNYAAIWQGPDADPLEGHGAPWCWGVRTPGGLGTLAGLQAEQWAPYEESMARARAAQAAEAARP